MTVDEALPNVRKKLQRKARVIASYRDELAELAELEQQGEATNQTLKRQANLLSLIDRNTTQALNDLQDDLEAIGRGDLKDALTRYARKCLAKKDAYLRINRLFLATDD